MALVLNFDITKLNYMKDRIDILCKQDFSFWNMKMNIWFNQFTTTKAQLDKK